MDIEKYYRVTVNGKGIYEVVDQDCPPTDPRRVGKPDGSWLPKVGKDFPGHTSFWTGRGFGQYTKSGLFDWHASVVNGEVVVEELIQKPEGIVYEDEFQIIVNPTRLAGGK